MDGDPAIPFDQPPPEDTLSPAEFGVGFARDSPPRPRGLLYLALGATALVGGIGLFIAGELVSHSVHTFNAVCADLPGCYPGTDLSGGMYVGGFGLILLGLFLLFVAFRRSLPWKATG
jgi:hypothetical protein